MKSKDNGLTVGELTIGIAALLIVGLLWATFTSKEASKETYRRLASPDWIKTI